MKTMETTKHTLNKMAINKIIGLIILLTLTATLFNCSKDDDGSHQLPEPTTMEKLTAGDGKWYFESEPGGEYDECYKNSNIKFLNNTAFNQETYGVDTNNECVLQGQGAANYELIDDDQIRFDYGDGNPILFSIVSLTENELIIQNPDRGMLVFDKTPGNYVREQTTKEKLTAGDGKWYFESPAHNACYKKSFIRFFSENTFIQEIHDLDSNDNCVVQSGGTGSGMYEVLSDTEIDFTFSGSTASTFTIISLTENELILQITANGTTSTIVLDKTEG